MPAYIIYQEIFAKRYMLLYISVDILPLRGKAPRMEIGKLVGDRVRQQRKALGMTQEQLETASGVPQGSISRIESGVAEDIYASTVLGFAKALQVSTDYLLGIAPLEQASSQSNQRPKRQRTRKAAPVD